MARVAALSCAASEALRRIGVIRRLVVPHVPARGSAEWRPLLQCPARQARAETGGLAAARRLLAGGGGWRGRSGSGGGAEVVGMREVGLGRDGVAVGATTGPAMCNGHGISTVRVGGIVIRESPGPRRGAGEADTGTREGRGRFGRGVGPVERDRVPARQAGGWYASAAGGTFEFCGLKFVAKKRGNRRQFFGLITRADMIPADFETDWHLAARAAACRRARCARNTCAVFYRYSSRCYRSTLKCPTQHCTDSH